MASNDNTGHVIRRWPWHPSALKKMKDIRPGDYVGVNSNRWVRVLEIIPSTQPGVGLQITLHCGTVRGQLIELATLPADQEMTVRA